MASDDHHVYPVGDAIEHVTNGLPCPCIPVVKPVDCNDGERRNVIVHIAIDGREHDELGHDPATCGTCRAAA